jgi:recombination protein RecA
MAKVKENLEVKDLEYDADGIFIQDGNESSSLQIYSTGSLGLDILTGGIGAGVIQLWGPDGIGKTTLSLIMAGEFQAAHNYENVRVYLHATEGRWNPKLISMCPKLLMDSPTEKTPENKARPIFRISRPRSGEKMYDWILKTLKQDKIKFFHIIDSTDHIQSECNAEKTMSEANKTASIASLNTRFLQDSSIYMNHYGHIVVYINQVRDKLDMGSSRASGAGKHHGGGNILNHSSNLRLGFDKLWTDLFIFENPNDTKSRVLGHIMKMKIEKTSNSGNVNSYAQVPFVYNHGIDRAREVAMLSEAYGLIQKKGPWFALDGANIAQGQVKLIQLLKENDELLTSLENKIKNMVGLKLLKTTT